jgi:hypothetical protein
MNSGNDDGMAIRFHPQNTIATKPVTQNDGIPIPGISLFDLLLNDLLHFLRRPVKGLLQKDEGDAVALIPEELILHDVTGDDQIFHRYFIITVGGLNHKFQSSILCTTKTLQGIGIVLYLFRFLSKGYAVAANLSLREVSVVVPTLCAS